MCCDRAGEKLLFLEEEKKSPRGKCSLCGIVGQGPNDFLCEDCANPELAVIYCEKCGQRIYLSNKDMDSAIWKFFSQLPNFPKFDDLRGISIKVSSCPNCEAEADKRLKILVYKIK